MNYKTKEVIGGLIHLFVPSILIGLGTSFIVSISTGGIINIPWYWTTLASTGIQWIYHNTNRQKRKLINLQVEYEKESTKLDQLANELETNYTAHVDLLKKEIEEYASKDYKKYILPLTCQACGKENTVELDLENTEFTCKFCEVENAIYTNFSTVVKTSPMYDVNDFLVNAT
jgi:hypothetical protein